MELIDQWFKTMQTKTIQHVFILLSFYTPISTLVFAQNDIATQVENDKL